MGPFQDWLARPDFWRVGLNYMATRLVVNMSQVFLPFYVANALGMPKTALASVPKTNRSSR